MNPLPFHLSQADSRPMYVQIMDGVKQSVLTDQWPAGEPLPSIREMAVLAKVSVITVKRAYQELEREGVIATRKGMGSFVAERADAAVKQKQQEIGNHLLEAVRLAQLLKIPRQELEQRLAELIQRQQL